MRRGEAADRRRIGDPPGAPPERGCPPWVLLGVKAVGALGALHGDGRPPWPNRLGGNRMKKLTGSQLFGGPTRARKTKATNKKGAAELDSGP